MTVRFEFDMSSKWLIQHHGDAMLWLGGARGVVTCRALQAEVVLPHKLPDGLLEVLFADRPEPQLFLLEIFTYPDQRMARQTLEDIALVFAERGELPEVLVLVLHPKGNVPIAAGMDLTSPLAWTRWQSSWRVVELWNLSAATCWPSKIRVWCPRCR